MSTTSLDNSTPAHQKADIHSRSNDVTFSLKIIVYFLLISLGAMLAIGSNVILNFIGVTLLGVMFAHGVELQHQALHAQGFRNRFVNDWIGVILGIPMLVSYADYKSGHLHHHRYLGTPQNEEFFDYGDQYGGKGLGSLIRWIVRLFMVSHYVKFLKNFLWAFTGKQYKNKNTNVSAKMRFDYLIMGVLLITFTLYSVITQQWNFFLYMWIAPLVFVATPTHALIEMPEHFQCNTNSTSAFENTRTIKSNGFMYWLTNGNNYHVEHHLMPGLPIDRLHDLHTSIQKDCKFYCQSYFQFYTSVLKSIIKGRQA